MRASIALALLLVLRTATPSAAETVPEPRVVVIDLERSRIDSSTWLGDAENVIAGNARWVAMLELVEPGRDARLRRRYRRRGLRVAALLAPARFAARLREFFPEWQEEALPLDVSEADGRSGAAATATGYDGAFHSYEEVEAELFALAEEHPQRARVLSLGTTQGGRQLWALKVAGDATVDDPGKPDVLFTGCHHAREWISVEPPMYIARRLLETYASDGFVRHLVDAAEIWLVPIVNPDGLAYSQGSPNNSSDGVRLWRKNRRPIPAGECGSSGGARGVDLNRNYLHAWRLPSDEPCPKTSDDVGASDSPSDFQLYRGPAPLSELEVQALADLTADPAHQFVARVDLHNYSQLVLYPWGYTSASAPDRPALSGLASMVASRLSSTNGVPYTPQSAAQLYIATGTSGDHSYGVDGVLASFIWELRPRNCCFYVPENQIEPINRETWAAGTALIDWGLGPPVLRRVEIVQNGAAVYRAEWVAAAGARVLEVSARAEFLAPGPALIELEYSKPMRAVQAPLVRLGRAAPYAEIQAAAAKAVTRAVRT